MGDKKVSISMFPVYGIILFLLLYLISASLYPGGSQFHPHSKGFSFTENYWCNLLNEYAINGQENKGRIFALCGMLVLSISLASFWYYFPIYTETKANTRSLIQFGGIGSMISGLFIPFGSHDLVINIASLLGMIALVLTIAQLFRRRWYLLALMGILNIILVAFNNLLYYNSELIRYLPAVQKLTFLCFLLWICLICITMFRKSTARHD